jgi:hypothetical protein
MQRKKGDPTDIILLLVMVFFLVISFVVTIYVNEKVHFVISTTVLNTTTAYKQIDSAFIQINEFTVQRGFVLFFAILIIGIMVSSFMIRVHPIFIFIYIITLGMAIFTSIYLANAYELVVTNGQLAAISENYAMMTYIMQHIAIILLAVGALSMIIIFGKVGGGGTSSTDI